MAESNAAATGVAAACTAGWSRGLRLGLADVGELVVLLRGSSSFLLQLLLWWLLLVWTSGLLSLMWWRPVLILAPCLNLLLRRLVFIKHMCFLLLLHGGPVRWQYGVWPLPHTRLE